MDILGSSKGTFCAPAEVEGGSLPVVAGIVPEAEVPAPPEPESSFQLEGVDPFSRLVAVQARRPQFPAQDPRSFWCDPKTIDLILSLDPHLQCAVLFQGLTFLWHVNHLLIRFEPKGISKRTRNEFQELHKILNDIFDRTELKEPGSRERFLMLFPRILQLAEAIMTGVQNSMKAPLLVTQKISQETVGHILSDVDQKPGCIYIGIPSQDSVRWEVRLEVIGALSKHLSGVPLFLSVEGKDLPKLYQEIISRFPEESNFLFALRPSKSFVLPTRESSQIESVVWPRDNMLLAKEEKTGIRTLFVSSEAWKRARFAYDAFARLAGAAWKVLAPIQEGAWSFQGGNHLMLPGATPRPLIGINEKFSANPTISDFLGPDTVQVGDPVLGQAFPHLDLYMMTLPTTGGGTVVVTDFERGWERLKTFQSEDWDHIEAEYERTSSSNEVSPYFIKEMRKRNPKFLDLMDRWVRHLTAKINQEAEDLHRAGITTRRIIGYPVPSNGSGLTYTNATLFKNKEGESILFLPSYGNLLDSPALQDLGTMGFQGQIVQIPMMDAAISLGGMVRCLTFAIPSSDEGGVVSNIPSGVLNKSQVETILKRVKCFSFAKAWGVKRLTQILEQCLQDILNDLNLQLRTDSLYKKALYKKAVGYSIIQLYFFSSPESVIFESLAALLSGNLVSHPLSTVPTRTHLT